MSPLHPVWRSKHLLREMLRWIGWRSRLASLAARPRPIILAFHTVADDELAVYPANVMPTAVFRRILGLIERAGRRVVSLQSLIEEPGGIADAPATLALTFDDGYRGCLETVAPMLLRREWPASFFVCPGFIDRGEPKWDDLLSLGSDTFDKRLLRAPRRQVDAALAALTNETELRRRCEAELLSWEGLRRLHQLGFSVQSHGLGHYFLPAQSRAQQETELVESKRRLEEELDSPVEHLAYPFGFPGCFDETTKRLARKAGYEAAFTSGDRYATDRADRFEIPRFGISSRTPFWKLQLIMSGAYR